MNKKDILFGLIVSVPMLGLGHIYAGDKKRGLTILGIQILIQVLAGVAMMSSKNLPTILYGVYFMVGLWAAYDTVKTINIVNNS